MLTGDEFWKTLAPREKIAGYVVSGLFALLRGETDIAELTFLYALREWKRYEAALC